ncbi:MAG: hypothetical protein F4X98_05845 [Gammaproteobacteria bacterium]|nr:hypothetical protein [Gammaproteobacteria bacterium]
MKRTIAWFATNHVAANLLMGFAVLAGLASLFRVPVVLYPDLDLPVIGITVPYLGAAPAEVESGVCLRVEEELDGVAGIKLIRSTSEEGYCAVKVELFTDADSRAVLSEVENRVNAIDTFPEDVETPVTRLVTVASLVADVAITGPTDERALKELGRQVRDDLVALPGITHASVANTRAYEVSVEVSEAALLRNRLTFDDVAAAVRRGSVDLPGGSIRTDQGEVLLRTSGQAYRGHELQNLVVTARSDGTRVLLKDVARVVDGFEDDRQVLRFDGKPAALVQVARVGSQDLRDISDTVRRFVEESGSRYPEGVQLTLWNDESVLLKDRLGALVSSGVQGMLLVLILLTVFLRPHLALWVTLGIPIAFLGAIFLLFAFGLSIDAISLIGFILALGMLVDDAVVVGENVYVAHRRGAGQLAGAIEGAQEVLVPVTFGVLTTVVAFTPLLFVEGPVGEIIAVMAATVLCCLMFSLIECQWVLPAHLGHRSARMPLGEFGMTFLVVVIVASFAVAPDFRSGAGIMLVAGALVVASHRLGLIGRLGVVFARFQLRCESALDWFVGNPFRKLVLLALRARHMTLAIAFVALAATLGLTASGHLPFNFMPPAPGDRIVAELTMPHGVHDSVTRAAVEDLIEAGNRLKGRLEDEYGSIVVQHIMDAVGSQPNAGSAARFGGEQPPSGSHVGEVILQLAPGADRPVTVEEVASLWRAEHGGSLAGGGELKFVTDRIASGADIEIRLLGEDLDDLRAVSEVIRAELAEYPGVTDIRDSASAGKEEMRLSIKPAGEALGLTLADVGRQVRQAFYGEEAQRIQRGRDDVRVMVRYPEAQRRSLEALYALRVRTPAGGEVPFVTVADVEVGRGTAAITRSAGKRSVDVMASVNQAITSANSVVADLDSGFLAAAVAAYPGVSYSLESNKRQREVVASLLPLFLLAMFGIFALLAIPLRSYSQPLIIMTVLPFAFVGAIWGTAFMGLVGGQKGLSMPSIFGIVAACGVVINSTLVLLHGVNRFRAAGDSFHDALVNAAIWRFRPILITTVTTFAGLTPLMLSTSEAALPLNPMATALAYGVLVSAVAALLVVPALWLVLHDIGSGAKKVTDMVGDMMGGAPRLSTWVSRYPYVQESLSAQEFTDLELPDDLGLDAETARIARQGLVRLYYEREFDAEEMREQLGAISAKTPMIDDFVGEARMWAEMRTFQLGVQMSRGVITPSEAARPLSDIIDTCLRALLNAAKAEFSRDNGEVPDGRMALVALGAAGRREFATGSPLKLLFVYDHGTPSSSLAIAPPDWYAQLLQLFVRLLRGLSPEGILYEPTPMQALPNTNGPASSLARLEEYFDGEAGISDFRLLTHARVIEAEGDLGERFEIMRRRVLSRERDHRELKDEVMAARSRLPKGGPWQVERGPGGLMDLELAVESIQIMAGPGFPDVLVRGLVPTFEACAEHGLLDEEAGRELRDAATLWQNLDGFFRMTCADIFDPQTASPEQKATIAEISGVDSFEALPERMRDTAAKAAQRVDAILEWAAS